MLSLFDQQQSRQKDKRDRRIKKNSNDTKKKSKPKKSTAADAPIGTFITNTTTRHQGGDSLLQLESTSDSLSQEHGPRQRTKHTTRRFYQNHDNTNRQLQRKATTCHPQETFLSTFLSRLSICSDKDKCYNNNNKFHRGMDRVVDSLATAVEEPYTTKNTLGHGTEHDRKNHCTKICNNQTPPSLPDLSQGLGGFVSATNDTKIRPTTADSERMKSNANATFHPSTIDMLQESNPPYNNTDTTLFGIFQGTTQEDLASTNKNQHVLVDDDKENKCMLLQHYPNRDTAPSVSLKSNDVELQHADCLLTPFKQSRKREVVASDDNHSTSQIHVPTAHPFVQSIKRRDKKKTPIRSDIGIVSTRKCLDASAGPKFICHADGTTPQKITMPIRQSRKRVDTPPYQYKSQRHNTTPSPSVQVSKRRDQKKTPALTTNKVTFSNSSPVPTGHDNPRGCDPYYQDTMVGHHQETPVKPQPPGFVFCSHGDQPPGRHVDENVADENGCHIDFQSHITILEDDTSHELETNSPSSLPAMRQSVHSEAVPLKKSNNRKNAPDAPPRIDPTDTRGDAGISFSYDATTMISNDPLPDYSKKRESHCASDTSHDEVDVISDQFEDADEDNCICINFKSDITLLSQKHRMATLPTPSFTSMLVNGRDLPNNIPTSSVAEMTDRFGVDGVMSAQHKSSILTQQTSSIRSLVSVASTESSRKKNDYPCDLLNKGTEVDKTNIGKAFDGGSTDTVRSKDGTYHAYVYDSNSASTSAQQLSTEHFNLETEAQDSIGNAGPFLNGLPSQDSGGGVVVDSARSHSSSTPVEIASENAGIDLSHKQCELNDTEGLTGVTIGNIEIPETTRTPLRRSDVKVLSGQTESSTSDPIFGKDLQSTKQNTSVPSRILRRQRRQPSRLGHFASENEIERKLNKKKKKNNVKTPVPNEQPKIKSRSTPVCSEPHSLKKVSFTSEEKFNSTYIKSPCRLAENITPAIAHPESKSNGTIDAVDVPTIDRKTWTDEEVTLLKVAHSETSPTKGTFWADIAYRVASKTEDECRSKWFALFKTPVTKKANTKKTYDARFIDDFFDATPFRQVSVHDNGSSLRRLDLGSAIKIDSDEIGGNLISRLIVHSDDEENYQHPAAFVPKVTKSQILNLRREMSKAVAEKKKQEKRKRNKVPRVANVPRMPHYFYSHDDIDIRARYDDDGGLHVEMPDTGEDDFWESLYGDDGDEG